MELKNETIRLPSPSKDSGFSLERAILERRTVRQFGNEPIALSQLSQLLWAAQGVTAPGGFRTAPSAGALYPLEVYVVIGRVDGMSPGTYRYRPQHHDLLKLADNDRRKAMARAALGQNWVGRCAALIVLSSVNSRTTRKYGRRGIRYVHIEVGHAAQNVLLQAHALGLGAAVVGAFDDDSVGRILDLPKDQRALYLLPVGKT
jgi:SagB-type dehydrogenase family enzyme